MLIIVLQLTETLKKIVKAKRQDLNIVASPKGLVSGDIMFQSADHTTVSASKVRIQEFKTHAQRAEDDCRAL